MNHRIGIDMAVIAPAVNSPRFLARRIAATGALCKALDLPEERTLLLADVYVDEDAEGFSFAYAPALASQFLARGVTAHLSLSEARQLVIAVVVLRRGSAWAR